jgi:hypothetical protein
MARLGEFRNADLRDWPTRWIVREIRPAKYATEAILRAYPRAFEEGRYRDARFVVTYRYDERARSIKPVSVRLASRAEARDWPYAVRFPGSRTSPGKRP